MIPAFPQMNSQFSSYSYYNIQNNPTFLIFLSVNPPLPPLPLCYHTSMRQEGEQVSNSVSVWRKQSGVTQEQFAKSVGVSRQTVISIEKGNYVPSVLLALKIATFFGKKVEEVFVIEKK